MVDYTAKAAAIQHALWAIPGVRDINSKNEFAALPDVLQDHELPEMAIKGSVGMGTGLAVATDRRVVWLRKGRRIDIREMPYTTISWVEVKHGRFSGEIALSGVTENLVIANTTKPLTAPFAEHVRQKAGLLDKVAAAAAKADAIDRSLQSIDTSGSFSGKWEVSKLPEILGDDELPLMISTGTYKGTKSRSASIGVIVATDRRLIFIDKGMFNSLTVEDFPYSTIQSVEASTGMMWGSLTIKSAGNAEEIGDVAKHRTHEIAEFIRQKVVAFQAAPGITDLGHTGPISVADELLKLSQLRDAGVLTDEEFEAQKAKLLG